MPDVLFYLGAVSLIGSCSFAVVAMRFQWRLTTIRCLRDTIPERFQILLDEPKPGFRQLLEKLDEYEY